MRGSFLLAVSIALALGLMSVTASAQEADSLSYWGPIPPEGASTSVTHRPASTAVEQAVAVPFHVATYPIYLFTRVVKAGLVFADEHDVLPSIGGPPPIHLGNVSVGPAFTVGGHSGIGGGPVVLVKTGVRDRDLLLRYITTTKGMHRGSAGFRTPRGANGVLEIGAGYRLSRNMRFFGIGPTAEKEDLSYFTQEQYWGGVGYRRKHSRRLTSEWTSMYSSIATRGPRSEDSPGVTEVFAPALPEGFGERSEGVLTGALLRLDTTQGTGRPEPGTVAQVQAGYFAPTDGPDEAFWRYEGEAGGFVPLFFTDRALAVRGAITWTESGGNDVVPFSRLATNHSGEALRGYRDYRWRDRGLVDLAAEYRWPAWALDRPHGIGVDAFLFLDSGQVFGDWDQIQARLWRTSFGGGFRAVTAEGFMGRIEIARSRESTQIRLQAGQMFDFKAIGLYRGNYHVSIPN